MCFFEDFEIYLFSLNVNVCTHTRQVRVQENSNNWRKKHNINTLYIIAPRRVCLIFLLFNGIFKWQEALMLTIYLCFRTFDTDHSGYIDFRNANHNIIHDVRARPPPFHIIVFRSHSLTSFSRLQLVHTFAVFIYLFFSYSNVQ